MRKKEKKVVKRKPWNRVEEQIYSVASLDKNNVLNMNIISYAVPINMKPKRYVLAIYKNTKTQQNIFENKKQKYILLQALSESQAKLVNVLGKKSGLKYDKSKFLEKQNLKSLANSSLKYLPDNAFTLLCKIEKYIIVGDHDLIIVNIEKVIENNFDKNLLDTEDLQELKIIL